MSDTEHTPEPQEAETEAAPEAEAGAETVSAEGVEAAHAETEKSFDQLESELDDLRERLLRAVADADNTRKRAEKEMKETRDYAVSRFAGDMLGVADNLARALDAARKTGEAEDSPVLKTLMEGVEMTERALISALGRNGVAPIDPQPGEAFDPHRHQAAAQIPSDQPSGKIAAVLQTGYVIGSRTLRAAMVAVSAGPAQAAPPSEGGEGGQVDIKA